MSTKIDAQGGQLLDMQYQEKNTISTIKSTPNMMKASEALIETLIKFGVIEAKEDGIHIAEKYK